MFGIKKGYKFEDFVVRNDRRYKYLLKNVEGVDRRAAAGKERVREETKPFV